MIILHSRHCRPLRFHQTTTVRSAVGTSGEHNMSSLLQMLGILGARNAASVEIGNVLIPAREIERTLHKYCKHFFIHTGDPKYPYRFFGSGTAVAVAGRHFVFCCGHQIDHVSPDDVAIYHKAKNITLTGSQLLKPTLTPDNNDTDWIDVRAMEFVTRNYSIENLSHQFFLVERRKNVWPENFDKTFIVYGYPSERQDVDYEIPHVTAHSTQVIATYEGTCSSPHLHRLTMNRKEAFDADGMSGGAVFYLGQRRFGEYFIGLAGMVMRGSKTSDTLYFVDADFMVMMAER
jgi:hypothetical protein